MVKDSNDHFDGLKARLQRLPFALTLADTTLPDHPLIFMNDEFKKITGYGDEMLGQNCRFLQDDLENDRARSEVRRALDTERKVQVVFHNRRKNGEAFYNMLLLENLKGPNGEQAYAVGSQFDLGDEAPDAETISDDDRSASSHPWVTENIVALQLERRRMMADATSRLIKSWFVLNAITVEGK